MSRIIDLNLVSKKHPWFPQAKLLDSCIRILRFVRQESMLLHHCGQYRALLNCCCSADPGALMFVAVWWSWFFFIFFFLKKANNFDKVYSRHTTSTVTLLMSLCQQFIGWRKLKMNKYILIVRKNVAKKKEKVGSLVFKALQNKNEM